MTFNLYSIILTDNKEISKVGDSHPYDFRD